MNRPEIETKSKGTILPKRKNGTLYLKASCLIKSDRGVTDFEFKHIWFWILWYGQIFQSGRQWLEAFYFRYFNHGWPKTATSIPSIQVVWFEGKKRHFSVQKKRFRIKARKFSRRNHVVLIIFLFENLLRFLGPWRHSHSWWRNCCSCTYEMLFRSAGDYPSADNNDIEEEDRSHIMIRLLLQVDWSSNAVSSLIALWYEPKEFLSS